ncbi:hypothetical protein FIBSPDRAFT_868825 [Athelia psychrophila]|uniref:Uncharacterized protein n=1 Tax=Athelia psychrophila TaxID=1759441 RepID=A0A166CSH0_9AGAM|nr:hypothetical protein FIBSPDRAFT_868825 [Fibularhizoctonia sp. CBS 109695]
MDVRNHLGSNTTYNYHGPVHYHSYCSIHGCPNHTATTTPNSVIPDPLAGVGDDTAGLPMSDGRAVSSPGTNAMEAPIGAAPPASVHTGRFKFIITRLIRALPSRRSARPHPSRPS